MKSLKFLIPFMAILLIISIPGKAAAEGIGLVTGSKTGTYIKIGKDIAKIAQENNVDIIVKHSEGSLDNIERMLSSENAAFGIVQSDVLGYLYSAAPHIARNLRLIYPLYNEEVHIFARKDIASFKDLNGKSIAIGTKGSGNWLTMTNMMHMMKIKPGQGVTDMKPLDAVTAVLAGDLDAMIYVAGKPVSLFTKLENLKDDEDPEIRELLAGVHFLSLDDPTLLEQYYVASEIGTSDYTWIDSTTPTIAVKAVLVSFDFSRRKSSYYMNRCDQLFQIGGIIRDNIEQLQQEGHKKWQEVDLDQKIGRWELDKCAHRPGAPRMVEKAPTKKHHLWKKLQKKILQD